MAAAPCQSRDGHKVGGVSSQEPQIHGLFSEMLIPNAPEVTAGVVGERSSPPGDQVLSQFINNEPVLLTEMHVNAESTRGGQLNELRVRTTESRI